MNWTRRRLALYLALIPGIGGRTVRAVLLRSDLLGHQPGEILSMSAETLREEYGLGRKAADAIAMSPPEKRGEVLRLMDRLEQLRVNLVTAADAHYPQRLENMDPDPPPALYYYGNARLLEGRTFSVLSSRNAPTSALALIERLTEEGVLSSEILVTGHNRPEYMRSAVVPLRWGSPRVLCLDRGLFRALGDDLSEEPFAAARLWRYRFDPATDLVVSPVGPSTNYGRPFNRLRDRLIGCLSDRIDFPFLRSAGNMEGIARMALRAGRPVRVDPDGELGKAFVESGAEPIPDAS